jgi:hypothetical protein
MQIPDINCFNIRIDNSMHDKHIRILRNIIVLYCKNILSDNIFLSDNII